MQAGEAPEISSKANRVWPCHSLSSQILKRRLTECTLPQPKLPKSLSNSQVYTYDGVQWLRSVTHIWSLIKWNHHIPKGQGKFLAQQNTCHSRSKLWKCMESFQSYTTVVFQSLGICTHPPHPTVFLRTHSHTASNLNGTCAVCTPSHISCAQAHLSGFPPLYLRGTISNSSSEAHVSLL